MKLPKALFQIIQSSEVLQPFWLHMQKIISVQIQNLFYPYICCICGETSDLEQDICNVCINMIVNDNKNRCFRCGMYNDKNDLGKNKVKNLCCNKINLHFNRMLVISPHTFPLNKFIYNLKYKNKLYYGKILGQILLSEIKYSWYKNMPLPKAIIPVPLHYKKYIQRGFNQTFEILSVIEKNLDIPVLYDYCIKIKNSIPQTHLNKHKRAKNTSQVYAVNKNKTYTLYDHVAIFDDVVTTMSTVNAVSEIIKQDKLKFIDVWCICRA